MNTSSLHNLKQSRIVVVDDTYRYLTRYTNELLNHGYTDCVPIFIPHHKLGKGEKTTEQLHAIIQRITQNEIVRISEAGREEYRRRSDEKLARISTIIPTNVSYMSSMIIKLLPQLLIIGSVRGYTHFSLLRRDLPELKIIGASNIDEDTPKWKETRWKVWSADAFFDKRRQQQELPTLVNAVLRDLPEARATLEGRMEREKNGS